MFNLLHFIFQFNMSCINFIWNCQNAMEFIHLLNIIDLCKVFAYPNIIRRIHSQDLGNHEVNKSTNENNIMLEVWRNSSSLLEEHWVLLIENVIFRFFSKMRRSNEWILNRYLAGNNRERVCVCVRPTLLVYGVSQGIVVSKKRKYHHK